MLIFKNKKILNYILSFLVLFLTLFFFNISYATGEPTLTLTANPNPVSFNNSSTITWESTNTASCSSDATKDTGTSGSFDTGPLTNDTSFSVTCTGNSGSITKDILVSIVGVGATASLITVTATPATIESGESSTITWESTNTASCDSGGHGTGTSGSFDTGPLTSSQSYTVICATDPGPSGISDTATIIVNSSSGTPTDPTYKPLAKLPGLESFDSSQPCALGGYLKIIINLLIGFSAVLAMLMIVMGGIQYMTSEAVSSKGAGKERIKNAILGLLIALSAYLILNTINPNLLNLCLDKLPTAKISITEETIEETFGVTGKAITINGQTLKACNEEELVTIPFMGKQIRVNKVVEQELKDINTAWQNSTNSEVKNYPINVIHSYKCRHIKNQPSQTSAHAYGIALDINPSENPYSKTTCITDMPQPAFVKLFTDKGWGWGGNWTNKKDAMHFSKLPGEKGTEPCP